MWRLSVGPQADIASNRLYAYTRCSFTVVRVNLAARPGGVDGSTVRAVPPAPPVRARALTIRFGHCEGVSRTLSPAKPARRVLAFFGNWYNSRIASRILFSRSF